MNQAVLLKGCGKLRATSSDRAVPLYAEVETLTATHTYIRGDHDSKDDARHMCYCKTQNAAASLSLPSF